VSIVWEKKGYDGKRIRLTEVQKRHISFFHPEVLVNEDMLMETIAIPDLVTRGGQPTIRVLYRYYANTPVTSKYLAVVTKLLNGEGFIVTSYFTDRIRRTSVIWKRTSS
jgi:hypothetical protein